MKKQLIWYVIILVVAITGVCIWAYKTSQPATQDDGKLILYYRVGCPHCENVEKYMEENNVTEKVAKLEVKEGATDQANLNEMLAYAKKCKLSLSLVGYPFLWTGSDCLMGDGDIINYFSQQISK